MPLISSTNNNYEKSINQLKNNKTLKKNNKLKKSYSIFYVNKNSHNNISKKLGNKTYSYRMPFSKKKENLYLY